MLGYALMLAGRYEEAEEQVDRCPLDRPSHHPGIRGKVALCGYLGRPVKAAYMWRDIERRAAMYGLPARVPAPYPLAQWDVANRVAVLGAAEGWVADYARATYRRWFAEGLEPGSERNLSDSLREIGQEPARVLGFVAGSEIGEAYEAATDAARKLGIFGSPSFVVGRELFWGDDRLDDAIAWYRRRSLTQ